VAVFGQVNRYQWKEPGTGVLGIGQAVQIVLDKLQWQQVKEFDTAQALHKGADNVGPSLVFLAADAQGRNLKEQGCHLFITKLDLFYKCAHDLQRKHQTSWAFNKPLRNQILNICPDFLKSLHLSQFGKAISYKQLYVSRGGILDIGGRVKKIFAHDAYRSCNILKLLAFIDSDFSAELGRGRVQNYLCEGLQISHYPVFVFAIYLFVVIDRHIVQHLRIGQEVFQHASADLVFPEAFA